MKARSAMITIALLASGPAAFAQGAEVTPAVAPPGVPVPRFTFGTYLDRVGKGNLELSAQRTNVSVVEAQIAVARVFPDPAVTAGLLQYDVDHVGNPTATIVQLNVPLQIGGQRGARVAFAEANLSATQAELDEFFRGLRANAANAYIDALHARLVVDRRRQTLSSLERLVSVNEQRHRAGDIGEAPVLQSRVEASQFRAQVLDGEGVVRTADLSLTQLLGTDGLAMAHRGVAIEGDLLSTAQRSFSPPELVRVALVSRPDLVAARRRRTAAERQIDLARANRIVDVGVGVQWQHNFASSQSAPPQASNFVGGTVTVPIPLSRLYRGELDAAHATKRESDLVADAVAVRVEVEVLQALARYETASARVKLYTSGVLADADSVLEKTLYTYQHGGASLVEVLVAQRSDNDAHLAYFDALGDAAHALVAVQQAVGTWDFHL